MSEADAVALFRPRVREKLTPFLDLDDESAESDGLYAESLEDGSILVHTFQPYAVFEASEAAAIEWLSQFGDALADVHDDPRGLLVFPDTIEPEGRSYDAVIAEVEPHGLWIMGEMGDDSTLPYGIDAAQLAEVAGRLIGDGARTPSSFELGQMLSGLHQGVLDAMRTADEALSRAAAEPKDGAPSDEPDEPGSDRTPGKLGK